MHSLLCHFADMSQHGRPKDLYAGFHGPNAGYVLELLARFEQNPQSVDAATRAFFET
jgi:hypothetical protein